MGQQADSFTTAVPTSFNPAVESRAINHVPNPVDHRDERKIIVLALPAPDNPVPGPFSAQRERRTFWTACASCKKRSKHSIEYLSCTISCCHCSETFKATEVSRPRNQRTASSTENVHSGAIVTSPVTMVEPSKMIPTVESPPQKKVKREKPVQIKITKRFCKDEIKMFLISKGRNKITEATMKGNYMKKMKSEANPKVENKMAS